MSSTDDNASIPFEGHTAESTHQSRKSKLLKNLLDQNSILAMDISITDVEKQNTSSTLSLLDSYMAYLIETRLTDQNSKGMPLSMQSSLWRRYSEFEILRNYLQVTYPYIIIPPMPEKRASYVWQKPPTDKFDPNFIDRRRTGLEKFLLRIVSHPILSQDKVFLQFLTQDEDWKESFKVGGLLKKADNTIRILNASFRLKKSNRQFEEAKIYGSELSSNISNVLKARTKLADRAYAIHKVHANYGRVFSEWSNLEKNAGDTLQSAGHYVDVFSSAVENFLEEEELFADQLKEYLYFAESLKCVCRHQEMFQYELERLEDSISSKKQELENIVKGNQSFMSKLLSSSTSKNGVEAQQHLIEKHIRELESQIELCKMENKEFIEKALVEIESFHHQKLKDLKEALICYIILWIKMCTKGISVWKSIRECFLKM